MAGIGEDIKEVLNELATPFTIHKADGTSIKGEKLDMEVFTRQSTEWIRQTFVMVTLVYDTSVEITDVLEMAGNYYIVTSMDPSWFEGEIVDYSCACFRCNCLGSFSSFNEDVGVDTDYEPLSPWTSLYTNVHALMRENDRDSNFLVTGNVSGTEETKMILYTNTLVSVNVGDRFFPSLTDLTEYYMVTSIHKYRLRGTYIYGLSTDTRD